jgi:predicted RNase H-like nuclease
MILFNYKMSEIDRNFNNNSNNDIIIDDLSQYNKISEINNFSISFDENLDKIKSENNPNYCFCKMV